MIFGSNRILGLSVSDRTIACAEVESRAGKVIVRRTATLEITPEASFDKPEALGTALAKMLREQGFDASVAVVGVPAKWLMAMERELPPAAPETARSVLRLAAERLSVSDGGDAVFDYSGESSSSKPTRVLLVGILRRQLERVQKMAASAELEIQSVMPSSLAVAAAAQAQAGAAATIQPMVLMGRNAVEMVWPGDGGVRMLRHLPAVVTNGHDAPFLRTLGPELKRNAALAGGQMAGERRAMLWDGVGLSDAQVADLSATSGLTLQNGGGAASLGLDVAVAASGSPKPVDAGDGYVPAMALGMAGARPQIAPINFLSPRLAPPVPKRFSKPVKYAIAGGAMLLIFLGWLVVDVQIKQSQLTSLKTYAANNNDALKEAKAFTQRMDLVEGYFQDRTPVLDCLKTISECFNDNERIYVITFSFRENGKGMIVGKSLGRDQSNSQAMARSLDNSLRSSPGMTEVSLKEGRISDAKVGNEYAFSFSFTFNPVPAKREPAKAVK